MLESTTRRNAINSLATLPVPTGASVQQLTTALLAAVLAETLLLRVIVRIGVHVPKDRLLTGGFEAASSLGSLVFNFASILSIALLTLLAVEVLRRSSTLTGTAIVGLCLGVLSGLALSLTTDGPTADAIFGVSAALLAATLGISGVLERTVTRLAAAAMVLMILAYLSYQYYVLGYVFYRLADLAAVPPVSTPMLRVGEVLALVAAVAAFCAWGLPRWRYVGSAGMVAVVLVLIALTGAALSPASTISILALWTTGISLFLPFPVYLFALGLFLLTIVACWRSDDGFWIAAGLLLVMLGGYMPESTYQHVLLLLGLLLISGLGWRRRRKEVEVREGPAVTHHGRSVCV